MRTLDRLFLQALAVLSLFSAPGVRAAITDNLVVHLTLDNALADLSGRTNDATSVGSTPFIPGKVGSNAVALSSKPDGSSFNYLTLGARPDLNFGPETDFSISLWARFTNWTFDPLLISNKDWLSGANPGYAIATGTDGRLQWNYSGPPGLRKDYDGPAGTLSDGQWHHVLVTFLRAGEVTTYLDGAPVDVRDVTASLNDVDTPPGLETNIGQDGSGGYTDGGTVGIEDLAIDDLGIWRRVLTATEAKAIFDAGAAGNNLASVNSTNELPVISAPPSSQAVVAGADVTFKALPRGSSPFTFQWLKNDQPISGATRAILVLTNAQTLDAGAYTVQIENAAGSVRSEPADLTVDSTQAPTILVQPLSQSTALGGAVTFVARAAGVAPLSFQWSKNGALIPNATNTSLSIARAEQADAGQYVLTITGGNAQAAATTQAQLTIVDDIGQNLVLHLTFDEDFADSSGRNNHATPQGNPALVPGRIGSQALRFSHDATNFNYLTLGTPVDLDFSFNADFSFSFWVKFSAWKRDPVFISNKSWLGSGANIGYALATGADGRFQWNFREQVGDRVDYDTAAGLISDGAWHHIGVSFKRGGEAKTFVDGVQLDTRALPTSETTIQPGFPTNIGQDGTGSYSEAGAVGIEDGTIDDLAIWRRAVTVEEFQTIYQKGQRLGANVREKAITDELVLHLPFDGDLSDHSGGARHGSKVGNPGFVPGQVGSQALSFSSSKDGSSFNFVTLGSPQALNFGSNQNFSVSFWTRFSTWTGDPPLLGNKDWSSGGNQGWLVATAGNGRLQWNVGDGDAGGRTRYDYDGPAGTLTNGSWHHVTITFDREAAAVTYLDGQAVSTNAISPDLGSLDTPGALAMNIGQDGKGAYTDNGGVGISDGQIDDVAIWRRILEPAEVARVYTNGLAGINVQNQASAPTSVTLSVTHTGQSLLISWPPGTTGFALETTQSLGAGANWQPVQGVQNNSYSINILSEAARYYRLRR